MDLALNHRNLQEAGYSTIQALLLGRGCEQDPRQPFIFHRTVTVHGKPIRLECKNVRSPDPKRKVDSFRAELQKTRNSKDGAPTRAYRIDQFEILSVALFNRTGQWNHLHICVKNLACRRGLPELLEIMQTVPHVEPYGYWRQSLVDALLDYERQSKTT